MRASRGRGATAVRGAAIVVGACALVAGTAGAAAAATGDRFTITGELSQTLFPGGSGALDLRLTNPNGSELTVTGLAVRIASVTPQPLRTCLIGDFVVDQLEGMLSLKLAANSSRTLSELGVPATELPQVSMTNTTVNQDGCKLAVLNLSYAGTSTEADPATMPPRQDRDDDGDQNNDHDDDRDRDVAGEDRSGELPGTGGDASSLWLALAGLGLVTLGGGSVLVAHRVRGAQK